MTFPARVAILVSLFLCWEFAGYAQTKLSKDRATVSGKVTIKGKAAPGIIVGIRLTQPDESSPTFKATTDQDGHYRINNVPVGTYLVAPVARAFVISDPNIQQSQTVIITGTENVEGINFELVRGGVITGKVTDADGDPLVEERVMLLAVVDQQDRTRPQPQVYGSIQTDDRGIYRMFGIRRGRYKVFVGQADDDPIGFYVVRGRPPLPQSFYRDPGDPDQPGIVEIDNGTEASKIDITVGPVGPAFSASGRVVDQETGKPPLNVSVILTRIASMDPNNNVRASRAGEMTADAQGEFQFQNLRPGKYQLAVFGSESDLQTDQPLAFEIVDEDLTGLIVKTSKAASVTGVVVFDGKRDATVDTLLRRAAIYASTRNEENSTSSSIGGALKPDGSFHISGLRPGILNFSVESRGPRRLTLTRVERDGVVPSGIQIQGAEQITGITLFVTSGSGSIRGLVKTENGNLPPGGRLVIQVSKPDEPKTMQGSVVDPRGHFLIEGLVAGTYQIIVTAYTSGSRRPPSTRQLVDVADAAATEVTITLDLATIASP